jgi:hypothetical protein
LNIGADRVHNSTKKCDDSEILFVATNTI